MSNDVFLFQYKNYEHDQVVRETDSSEQGVGASKEFRRRRKSIHWKLRSRGR